MKHTELVKNIAVKLNSSDQDVELWLQATAEILTSRMVAGELISFQGFGSFELKRKEERLSVHPSTKERTLVPPKLVVNFKQSSTLKVKLKTIAHHE